MSDGLRLSEIFVEISGAGFTNAFYSNNSVYPILSEESDEENRLDFISVIEPESLC